MSFVKRKIEVTIKLGKGNFGQAGFDTVTLKGLRVSAQVQKTGMPSFNTAQLRIYGMTLSLMNTLSTLGKRSNIDTRDNTVSISVGNDGAALAMVFTGVLQEGWANFNDGPEVFFTIDAHTGLINKMKPVPPTSYAGAVDVATIIETLATSMGYAFENKSGVSVMLSNQYLPGTALEQAQTAAQAANINFALDDGTMAIWPIGGSRGGTIPLISAATGMVGYPSYTGTGVQLRTLYNPAITFGGEIEVDSITPAKGRWTVNVLHHNLESEMPNGAWFTEMEGYRYGQSPTVPG